MSLKKLFHSKGRRSGARDGARAEACLFSELAGATSLKFHFSEEQYRDAPVRDDGRVYEVPKSSCHGGAMMLIEPALPQDGSHFICMHVEEFAKLGIVGMCNNASLKGRQAGSVTMADAPAVQIYSDKLMSTNYFGSTGKRNILVPEGGVVTLLVRSEDGKHTLSVFTSQDAATWTNALAVMRDVERDRSQRWGALDSAFLFVALGHGDKLRIIDPPAPLFWSRSAFSYLAAKDRAVITTLVTLSYIAPSPVALLSPELVDMVFENYLFNV
eukprot:TRINITY_DN13295_c0_g1_i1.p1 TRINITY_DN13295_c0_g1~~TRINITY_DN13295_c0_g1_i1.p1  ORF type:complete len:271 (+),score=46.74 TRINITY_DN13295_c0_g1_i1:224-1036(+)